ncbi:hypothetical protein [Streptomyces sp. NPDC008121]
MSSTELMQHRRSEVLIPLGRLTRQEGLTAEGLARAERLGRKLFQTLPL